MAHWILDGLLVLWAAWLTLRVTARPAPAPPLAPELEAVRAEMRQRVREILVGPGRERLRAHLRVKAAAAQQASEAQG